MACELCGRSSCTRCFHSFDEQEEFDTKTGRYAPKSPHEEGGGGDAVRAYRELQARLATAERERDGALRGEKFQQELGESRLKQLITTESKLAHLERLVEGLPVYSTIQVIQRRTALGTKEYAVHCEGGDVATFHDESEATALAALLEHRRGMK